MRVFLTLFLCASPALQDSEIQKLIKKLGSASFEEQGKAATILESLGAEALSELEKAAAGGDAQIRDWAVKIKGRIQKRLENRRTEAEAELRRFVAAQVQKLASDDFGTQGKAAEELKQRGKDLVPHLKEALLQSKNTQVSNWLEKILESFGQKQAPIDAAPAWKNRYPTRLRAPDPAVAQAAKWLARHQGAAGGWGGRTFSEACSGAKCGGTVDGDVDIGLTGLALLALMGAGYGPTSEDEFVHPVTGNSVAFGEVVKRGLMWLSGKQDNEGCIGERGAKFQYGHMIATMALCEAYGMSGSAILKEPAKLAVDFTLAAQNPRQGWRYSPRSGDSDTSVTGWATMALRAAELADLPVNKDAFAGAIAWLDHATELSGYYQVGYNGRGTGKVFIPGKNEQFDHHATMTAIAVVSRLLLQKKRTDPALKGIHLMAADVPRWKMNATDMYYWYWGAMAVFQMEGSQGPLWKTWSDALKTALGPSQRTAKDGCANGSWDPEQERWGSEGGRIYTTALGAMILSTPHRFALVAPDGAARKK